METTTQISKYDPKWPATPKQKRLLFVKLRAAKIKVDNAMKAKVELITGEKASAWIDSFDDVAKGPVLTKLSSETRAEVASELAHGVDSAQALPVDPVVEEIKMAPEVEAKSYRGPITETKCKMGLSEDGKWFIHKTITTVTDIKSVKYVDKVLEVV